MGRGGPGERSHGSRRQHRVAAPKLGGLARSLPLRFGDVRRRRPGALVAISRASGGWFDGLVVTLDLGRADPNWARLAVSAPRRRRGDRRGRPPERQGEALGLRLAPWLVDRLTDRHQRLAPWAKPSTASGCGGFGGGDFDARFGPAGGDDHRPAQEQAGKAAATITSASRCPSARPRQRHPPRRHCRWRHCGCNRTERTLASPSRNRNSNSALITLARARAATGHQGFQLADDNM